MQDSRGATSSVLTSAVSAVIAVIALDIAKGRGIKLVHGKRHVLEHLAWVIRRGRDAFLFGNGIFRAVNEILCRALDAHHGEEAEGDGEQLCCGLAANSAAETAANDIGQILCGDAGTAAFAGVHDLCAEDDGIYDLKHSAGKIGARDLRRSAAAEILLAELAFEDVDIALAAIKNNLLFHDGDTFDLLRSADAGTDLGGDLDIHGDAYLIKTPIEGNGVYVYVRADDLRTLRAYASASFQKVVASIRKINGDILEAVLVATAVKNSVGVYIYGRIATHLRRVSHIRHKISSDSYFRKTKIASLLYRMQSGQKCALKEDPCGARRDLL